MIRETELNLLVPSPELLVRLASGDEPLGLRAGPPHIRMIRETYFDTPDDTLRRRGMTCKLRQEEGGETSVVVTLGEGTDEEGITSRTRLSASAVGMGFFESLRGESEAAAQIQKFVRPAELRPRLSLDIQRLARVHRRGLLRRPTVLLNFDRITVQVGGKSTVFHEIRIRRRRKGRPQIQELAQRLRDEHHLFPDGLSTLQRANRIHHLEQRTGDSEISPYTVNLALAIFRDGKLGLQTRNGIYCIPTFRGSGEDAARALCSDLTDQAELGLLRLGTTEPREGRQLVEVWAVPDPGLEPDSAQCGALTWYPWHQLLERVGSTQLRQPLLISSLLLLTRRRLLGQLHWVPDVSSPEDAPSPSSEPEWDEPAGELPEQLEAVQRLMPLLRRVESVDEPIPSRLSAISELSEGLKEIFRKTVSRSKERLLSHGPGEEDEEHGLLLDLLSIRIRGITDRLYRSLDGDLLSRLEKAGVHLRSWSGVPHEDRRAFLTLFGADHLPKMRVSEEWGPAFIPDMPPEGSAVGLLSPSPEGGRTRFFHLVLAPDTPSFLQLPGSPVVLPLEEVVRGYFFSEHPELEKNDTYLFRFTTGEVTVRRRAAAPPRDELADTDEDDDDESGVVPEDETPAVVVRTPPAGEEDLLPIFQETRETIVTRVLARKKMPEGYQAQLLRALERQVSRRNPLIGWSDLYPVKGPLDLTGIDALAEIMED